MCNYCLKLFILRLPCCTFNFLGVSLHVCISWELGITSSPVPTLFIYPSLHLCLFCSTILLSYFIAAFIADSTHPLPPPPPMYHPTLGQRVSPEQSYPNAATVHPMVTAITSLPPSYPHPADSQRLTGSGSGYGFNQSQSSGSIGGRLSAPYRGVDSKTVNL